MARINLPATKKSADFVVFTGGLDITTPVYSVPSGYARRSSNFEEDILGGYQTVKGYERFSGKPSPSSSVYYAIPYSLASGSFILGSTALGSPAFYLGLSAVGITVGTTIVGAISGATGFVIGIDATTITFSSITGTFLSSEPINGASVTVYGPAVTYGATGLLDATSLAAAADITRAGISAVPGSGSILGVYYYKGVTYAFRNNAGATAQAMYKSSSTGWQLVNLGYEIAFSNANTSVGEGDTLTQGAVTATINRVVLETGTLLSGVNTGRLMVTPISGSFAVGAATSTGGGALTLGGAATAITIPNINGRYEIFTTNFSGSIDRRRMYGCDGKNYAFEFDGTVFVPIHNTGMGALDTPEHIFEHKNYLFLSYKGSVQHSGLNAPYNFTAISGAVEISTGDNVTGFVAQPGNSGTGTLIIYCRNKTYMLYGTGPTSWVLDKFNGEAGGIAYTMQRIDAKSFTLDDRGVTTLDTVQQFGNFEEASVSLKVKSWFNARRGLESDSMVSKDKQQYRIFFNDGSAAYWTIGNGKASMMPIQLNDPVTCSCAEETYGGGEELIFFGSNNGFVYQMERGTSFDGVAIDSFIDMVFNNSKSYRVLKKYRRLTFEISGSGYSEFSTSYYLGYNSIEVSQPDVTSQLLGIAAVSYWDNMFWDSFVWDGSDLTSISMSTPGNAENIAVRVISNSTYSLPVKFSGVYIEYSPLRTMR